jgi:alpha-ketoglutarate-dependent taurine dioxygenase
MKATQLATSTSTSHGEMQGSATSLSSRDSVHTELLPSGSAIPLVIRSSAPDVDLVDWATNNREWIESQLIEHRALLFRGFQVKDPPYFHSFVKTTSNGPLLEYIDRSTPRYEVSEGIYVSTIYPSDQRIHPHNEGTYWKTWPRKIYFCCLKAPARGGETPIADVRKVNERIDPAVRDLFREKQVMYVRNYNPGIGLTWQDAFQTNDPKVVEEYGLKNAIQIEWTKNKLRTRQVRPATRKHPVTGEEVWFNHAAFFHVSSLDPEVQDALLSSYKEEGLPYNTYFGDGSRIDPAMIASIRQAYAEEKTMFTWHEQDILMLDNMSVAHAREPYTGERKVVVAMTEAQSDSV